MGNSMDGDVDRLATAQATQTDAFRPEAVSLVHSKGKLTARERIAALLDDNTDVQYGTIAARDQDGEWIPEAGGIDYVGTIAGHTVVASSTDYTDHGGGYGAGRLGRLIALAKEHRWPVVLFVDGGGSRARHPRSGLGHLELSGPIGPYSLFDGMAELSGWSPTVAIVSGPSFAGHASAAGFSDFLVATAGSSIGMGGPPMVEAALGVRMTAHELASVEMHDESGGIDLLVDDEPAAIEAARRYLDFYHDLPASKVDRSEAHPQAARINDVTTTHERIDRLLDAGSFFELRRHFARAMITGLGRMGGKTVGILANDSAIDDGFIDENAATKASRFIEQCDAYSYPVVSLIDTIGCGTRDDDGKPLPIPGRWHHRPLMAHHHRQTPLFAVQTGRARGLGAAVMAGFPTGQSTMMLSVAWPGVELGVDDGYATVLNHASFDDVIAPAATREQIIRLLSHLGTSDDRRGSTTQKRHAIDTW